MNVLADKLQGEFLNDILYEKFDEEKWKIKITKNCFYLEKAPDKIRNNKMIILKAV